MDNKDNKMKAIVYVYIFIHVEQINGIFDSSFYYYYFSFVPHYWAMHSSDKITELHPSLLLSTLLAVLQILTRLFQPLRKYKRYQEIIKVRE